MENLPLLIIAGSVFLSVIVLLRILFQPKKKVVKKSSEGFKFLQKLKEKKVRVRVGPIFSERGKILTQTQEEKDIEASRLPTNWIYDLKEYVAVNAGCRLSENAFDIEHVPFSDQSKPFSDAFVVISITVAPNQEDERRKDLVFSYLTVAKGTRIVEPFRIGDEDVEPSRITVKSTLASVLAPKRFNNDFLSGVFSSFQDIIMGRRPRINKRPKARPTTRPTTRSKTASKCPV